VRRDSAVMQILKNPAHPFVDQRLASVDSFASRTVAPRRLGDPVVTVELLATLDALLWLRTGERAAGYLQCTQSTVSRHSRRCLEVFGLRMEKRAGEWCLLGDPTLLNLQRGVHQFLRWQQGTGLRLDGQYWCRHLLEPGLPVPWVSGNGNYFEYERPLALLQEGVIDDWLCSAPDLPEHPDLHTVQLTAMPMRLVVKPGHPLLARPLRCISMTWRTIRCYPCRREPFPGLRRCWSLSDSGRVPAATTASARLPGSVRCRWRIS